METENLLIEVEDKNGNSEVEIDIKTKEITNGKNGNHHHTGKNNNQD
jgi:hypothetical protein